MDEKKEVVKYRRTLLGEVFAKHPRRGPAPTQVLTAGLLAPIITVQDLRCLPHGGCSPYFLRNDML